MPTYNCLLCRLQYITDDTENHVICRCGARFLSTVGDVIGEGVARKGRGKARKKKEITLAPGTCDFCKSYVKGASLCAVRIGRDIFAMCDSCKKRIGVVKLTKKDREL